MEMEELSTVAPEAIHSLRVVQSATVPRLLCQSQRTRREFRSPRRPRSEEGERGKGQESEEE